MPQHEASHSMEFAYHRDKFVGCSVSLLFLRVAAALSSDRGLDEAIFGTDLLTLQT